MSKKIEELKDRESRQFFYEEHIETALPIQIRELRKKRKLTQKELAKLIECDQSNVSDWENPNYEYTPQISTLKRLANAFDVPLIVRFGSWGELLEWDDSLSPEKVAPETFDEFAEQVGKEAEILNDSQDYKTPTTETEFEILEPVRASTSEQPRRNGLYLVKDNTAGETKPIKVEDVKISTGGGYKILQETESEAA